MIPAVLRSSDRHGADRGPAAAGEAPGEQQRREQEQEEDVGHAASSLHPGGDARLRALFADHFDFIWRSIRRFGLSGDHADDAAQQVFVIASRKLEAIDPNRERSFLFGTAMRVASDVRRSAPYRREIPHADVGAELEGGPRPDEAFDQARARELLDAVLHAMELDLRTVFVLFELEEMTTPEIASLLAIPPGTVASRLRRARDEFQTKLERLKRSWGPGATKPVIEGGAS